MELEELRKKIDALDEELLNVLAKRMALIPDVALYKKKRNLPFKQPEREQQLIEHKRELAKELGLNPDLVEKISRAIIDDALRIEDEI